MIGYKVVRVKGNKLVSFAANDEVWETTYAKNKISSNTEPLWYYVTLKTAIESLRYKRPSGVRIQIWSCKVINTKQIISHYYFAPHSIVDFWRRYKIHTQKYLKSKTCSKNIRVADTIELLQPITEQFNWINYRRNNLNFKDIKYKQ